MAVLKHTSPTASPSAPKPKPSMTVPSASTRRPVTRGASQSEKLGRAGFFAALGFAGRAGAFLAMDSISPEFSRSYGAGPRPSRLHGGAPGRISTPFSGKGISMGLRDQINDSLKEAMKTGDKRRVSTLRLINSAIKDRDIQNRTQGPDAGVSDAQIVEVLAKMVKQRQESLEIYEK